MIRPLRHDDLHAASAVCMGAFLAAVAPSLSSTGVATFTGLASADAFRERMAADNLILVADTGGALGGLAELKEGRHVAMLFVDPARQGEGIGAALLTALLAQARTNVLTVSASLSSVAFYERHGFTCSGAVGESSGLVYQPMARMGVFTTEGHTQD